MINLDEMVETVFTLPVATTLTTLFRNVGYLTVGETCIKDGFTVPADKIIKLDSNDALNQALKADSQEYMDISKTFVQKANVAPDRGRVNNVILYLATKNEGEDYGTLVDKFISINANYAQLLINSNKDEDIKQAAIKAKENNRLFVAQTNSEEVANKVGENIAKMLKELNNDVTLLTYHETANESLAAGLAGVMANPNLGSTSSVYATVTNVTPEDYTATVNANLKEQKVTYYTHVNPVNGGGVAEYATPIVYGGYMINGEDAQRRYIRFYMDIMLKARSIDFLKKKLGYEDTSADVLLSMLRGVLIAGQTNGLIKQDVIRTSGDTTITELGFEVKAIYPSELRGVDETLYNTQTYKIVGYYRDSLTGRKVEINLMVDPSDLEKSNLGF